MANIQINKIANANVYLNGDSFIGRVEDFELPKVKVKTTDHKGLGMFSVIKLPVGLEPMEGKLKWSSLYKDAIDNYVDWTKTCQLQLRASLEAWNSTGRVEELPVVVHLTGLFHEFDIGKYKHLDPVEIETAISIYALKVQVAGEEHLEIDVFANIYKINGQDALNTFRSNIGG